MSSEVINNIFAILMTIIRVIHFKYFKKEKYSSHYIEKKKEKNLY
jgi:hypothetical protein